jgi:hypothetical protein
MMMTSKHFSLILAVLLCTPVFSLARAPSFNGMYVGGTIGYRSFASNINNPITQTNTKFGGSGPVLEGLFGTGKAWKRLYVGGEVSIGGNTARSKKAGMSVGNSMQFGLAARIGAPLPNGSIIPYVGLGFEMRQMSFKVSTTKKFYDYSIAPLLGLQYAMDEKWQMRLEGAYQVSVKDSKLQSPYKFKQSPSSFLLKGSVVYMLPTNN